MYSNEKNKAQFDKKGFCVEAGWVKVFNYSETTLELIGTNMEYIPEGVGIPAHSCVDVPPAEKEGYALIRDLSRGTWKQVIDHRGKISYSTVDKTETLVDYFGEIKDGMTLLRPNSDYDEWINGEWIKSEKKEKAQLVNLAERKKIELLNLATDTIDLLSDSVELGISIAEEEAKLKEWRQFRVLLSRVDTSKTLDLEFPPLPMV